MTFDEKRAAALELLASKGLWHRTYAPTLVKWLWRLGVKAPPPHFAGFLGNLAVSGGVFGVGWGLVMWFAVWSRSGLALQLAVAISALAGLVIGLSFATYYRYSARKHSIPRWSEFAPPGAHHDPS